MKDMKIHKMKKLSHKIRGRENVDERGRRGKGRGEERENKFI